MTERPEREVRLSPEATRALVKLQENLARSVDTSGLNAAVRAMAQIQEHYARTVTTPAFEALQRVSLQMAEVTAPMRRAMADFERSIRPVLAQFAEAAERLQPLLESLARYPESMAWFGWPALEELDLPDAYWIVQQYDAGNAEAADEVGRRVIQHYPADRLQDMLRRWESSTLLARQVPLLRDGLEAHSQGRYTLSVPVLLLCVEAVAVTLVKPKKGRLGKKQREALVAATFREDAAAGELERGTLRATAVLFNQMLYGQWVHGDPIPPYLNRHAVLHGGDLEYGDEANSLRAILLLDLLQQQYGYFSLLRSDVFHETGCPRVRRLAAPAKHYLSARDAQDDGRRPCPTCIKNNQTSS